jgi:Outer membrane protein beta-barrel family/Carboxypeptidase regulatory-like domain
MLRLFSSLFVCLLCYSSFGQSFLKGRVIDSLTKVALPGATISLDNGNGKSLVSTTTNKDGNFKMSVAVGVYQLSVSFTGYKAVVRNIVVADTTLILPVIPLMLDMKNLKTAKITATKPLITMSPGKLVMNIAESGLSAGNTAWDMLQQAPGVQATDDGALNLNGKSVTVYVDGRQQYMSGEQLKNMLTAMQARQMDKLELISNPSARYDAAGGAIINIKTLRLTKPGFNGTFVSGIGSSRYIRYNTGVDVNYKTGKVNLYAGYDYSHNSNLYEPGYERVTGVNKPLYITENEMDFRKRNNHGYRMGLDWNMSKNTSLGFLLRGFKNDRYRSVTGVTNMGANKNMVDSFITANTTGDAVFSSPSLNVYFKTILDTSLQNELIVNADYYQYDKQWNDEFSIGFNAGNGSYQPTQYRRDQSPTLLDIYSLSADYSQPLWKGKLDAGMKASYVRTDSDVRWDEGDGSTWVKDNLRTNHFKYDENIHALYAGYSKAFGKWEADAALRTEITNVKGQSLTIDSTYRRNYQDWFPSLGIAYNASKNHQWSLSYRKSIDRPVYSFVNPFIIFRGQFSYFSGNTNLRPMYSNSVELGYGFKNMLYINMGYTHTSDYMLLLYTQDNATKVLAEFYGNVARRHSFNATLSFNKALKKWWNTSNYVSTALYTLRSPALVSNTSSSIYCFLNSSQSFSLLKWKSRLDISFAYNLPYNNGYYKFKAYGFMNMGFNKEIFQKKGNLRLNVTDIFKTNITRKTTLYNGLQNSLLTAYDTRTINLAFTYRFGKAAIRRAIRKSSIETETGRIQ